MLSYLAWEHPNGEVSSAALARFMARARGGSEEVAFDAEWVQSNLDRLPVGARLRFGFGFGGGCAVCENTYRKVAPERWIELEVCVMG